MMAAVPARADEPDPLAAILATISDPDPAIVAVLQPKAVVDALAWLAHLERDRCSPRSMTPCGAWCVAGRPEGPWATLRLDLEPAPVVAAFHVLNENRVTPNAYIPRPGPYPIPVKEALLAVFVHARIVAQVADAKKLETYLGSVAAQEGRQARRLCSKRIWVHLVPGRAGPARTWSRPICSCRSST